MIAFHGFGDAAPPPCPCSSPPFPWWMIVLGAAAGVAVGYVAKDQMDKKKGEKP